MEETADLWEALRSSLNDFKNGDLEWTELNWATYRGPIRDISLAENGTRIHIVLGWCVRQNLSAGGWIPTQERTWISISKSALLEVKDGPKRQLDFASKDKKGTFFPAGQNLSIPGMRGPGPTLVN